MPLAGDFTEWCRAVARVNSPSSPDGMKHPPLATVAASALRLKRSVPLMWALSTLLSVTEPANAGGMGRFLGALLARDVVRGAMRPHMHSPGPTHPRSTPKTFDRTATRELHKESVQARRGYRSDRSQ
jgi:hypothetical protein